MEQRIRFNGIDIVVDQGVFHPREETEFWVKKAARVVKRRKNPFILDIFAGTGCIGIYLLKEAAGSRVDFIDISRPALENTRKNLADNRIEESRFNLFLSDMFKEVAGERRYDFILANPPYVARKRVGEVSRAVLNSDPAQALFAGGDGMRCIRRFVKTMDGFLKKDGTVFMEFDPDQKEEIEKLFFKKGFKVKVCKDQFYKERFIEASSY